MRPQGVHPLYWAGQNYQPPENWAIKSVKEYATVVKGKMPSDLFNEPVEGSLPYLLIDGLDEGETLYTNETHLPTIEEADTVVVADGSRSGLAIRGVRGVLGSTLLAYRAKEGIDENFLYYVLESLYLYNNTATIGGAIPHLDKRLLAKLTFATPDYEEQRRIATALKLADDAINKSHAELISAQELFKTLLKILFEHGVTAPQELHRSKWITCPAHWAIKPLKKIATVQSGFTMGRDLSRAETVTVRYVTVVNVQDGRFDLHNIASVEIKREELATGTLRYGDILMTEGGDRDKLGRGGMWRNEIEPCGYQNHIFRVRLNADFKPELFHFLIQTYQAKSYFYAHAKQTSNLCTINSRELKNWSIAIPPISEQEKMIELLQAAETQCSAIENRLSALLEVKKSLLQNLLTGKIRIPPTIDIP